MSLAAGSLFAVVRTVTWSLKRVSYRALLCPERPALLRPLVPLQAASGDLLRRSSSSAQGKPGETGQTQDKVLLSEACVKRLQKIMDKGEYLRIRVEGGGCSGFQYKFSVDSTRTDDDRLFEQGGVGLLVDEESLEFLKGSMVDYNEELIRSSFLVLHNPQAEHGCSCGASFSVKL